MFYFVFKVICLSLVSRNTRGLFGCLVGYGVTILFYFEHRIFGRCWCHHLGKLEARGSGGFMWSVNCQALSNRPQCHSALAWQVMVKTGPGYQEPKGLKQNKRLSNLLIVVGCWLFRPKTSRSTCCTSLTWRAVRVDRCGFPNIASCANAFGVSVSRSSVPTARFVRGTWNSVKVQFWNPMVLWKIWRNSKQFGVALCLCLLLLTGLTMGKCWTPRNFITWTSTLSHLSAALRVLIFGYSFWCYCNHYNYNPCEVGSPDYLARRYSSGEANADLSRSLCGGGEWCGSGSA